MQNTSYNQLTDKDIAQIRLHAYKRGLRLGLAIASVILFSYIGSMIHAHNRLMDEVKATNYYYSLTKNK